MHRFLGLLLQSCRLKVVFCYLAMLKASSISCARFWGEISWGIKYQLPRNVIKSVQISQMTLFPHRKLLPGNVHLLYLWDAFLKLSRKALFYQHSFSLKYIFTQWILHHYSKSKVVANSKPIAHFWSVRFFANDWKFFANTNIISFSFNRGVWNFRWTKIILQTKVRSVSSQLRWKFPVRKQLCRILLSQCYPGCSYHRRLLSHLKSSA